MNKKLYIECLDKTTHFFEYENNYILNDLINIHKYFQTYKDIEDVCSLIKSINENSIKIDKNNQNIIITIKYTNKAKLINIDLKLSKTKNDNDKIILDLFNQINKANEEINILKNQNENLMEENQLIKNNVKI